MSAISDLFGKASQNDAAQQLFLWGVLYGLLSSVFEPELSAIQQESWKVATEAGLHQPAPPADLADWVVRNIKPKSDAADAARLSGVAQGDFEAMVEGAGEPPALQQVLEWWRRGFIPWGEGTPGEAGVLTAIRTSRIYDYWSDTIRKAQFEPPSVGDAVNAVLRNQVPREVGVAMAYFAGLGVSSLSVPGDADTSATEQAFKILTDTAGNPPSLTELLELARRNIIPWGNLDPATSTPDPTATTFAQGIFEGDAKDKWLPFYAELGRYLPPPRTIVTLLRDGVISTEQATQLFTAQGLTADLAASYVASATSEKVQAHKDLALSTVEDLYFAHQVDAATAGDLIGKLGYDSSEVAFLLALVDMRRSLAAVNSAVNRVGAYYTAHKVTRDTASSMLARLGVPSEQVDALLQTWDLTAQANVRLLTEAQITDAWKYGVMDQATAITELQALGLTPYDAWVVLSVKNKAPLPDQPPPGPPGVA